MGTSDVIRAAWPANCLMGCGAAGCDVVEGAASAACGAAVEPGSGHVRIRLSSVATATCVPSNTSAIAVTGDGDWSTPISFPSATFHIRTVPSREPEMSRSPAALNASPETPVP